MDHVGRKITGECLESWHSPVRLINIMGSPDPKPKFQTAAITYRAPANVAAQHYAGHAIQINPCMKLSPYSIN